MGGITCSECGRDRSHAGEFCPECGAKVVAG